MPFLALPAEIREKIYHYALVSPYPLLTSRPSNPSTAGNPPLATGLLRANKQTHAEARVVLYSRNLFDLPANPVYGENLDILMQGTYLFRFLRRIGTANSALIRRLRVPFPLASHLFGGGGTTFGRDEAVARVLRNMAEMEWAQLRRQREWMLDTLAGLCPGLQVLEMNYLTSNHFETTHWKSLGAEPPGESCEARVALAELKAGLDERFAELRQVVVHLNRVSPRWEEESFYGHVPGRDEWTGLSFRDTVRGYGWVVKTDPAETRGGLFGTWD
ncbi:hypothetical protein B0T19DRAFT_420068 [Cercophora scortea]|uniref:Uncharacterized protein n=1 Tax=Cercophora scortea TaxID=314031 RepID=A0AAE0MIW4_9PEZI|nr:hypothetical protein B0T19DRAFT_420068 [Cercophora scortea]